MTLVPAPGPAAAAAGLPLGAAQTGMWYAQALDPGSTALHTAEYMELEGPVRPDLFAQALHRTAVEAEALCVRITDTPDGPRQYRTDPGEPGAGFPLEIVDLCGEREPGEAAFALLRADLARPFLPGRPLFRHLLVRTGRQRWIWYRCVHHLVVDGFGHMLLAGRTAEVYSALAAGEEPPARTFGRFEDLLAEDAEYRSGERIAADRAHWAEVFADRPRAPLLAGRAALPSASFLRSGSKIPAETAEGLRRTADALRATWPEVLTAAVALYVSRAADTSDGAGASDIVLGMPMMGRMGSAALRLPGMVMNVVPLRLSITPATTLAELTRQVVLAVRAGRRHQRYRIEDLRRDLGLLGEGRALVGPLVNVLAFDQGAVFDGVPATTVNLSAGPVDDLTFNVRPQDGGRGPSLDLDANPALYTEGELASHARRFTELLGRVAVADPHAPLGLLGIATAEEEQRVLTEFNDTARDLPVTALTGPFEEQSARTPGAPALVLGERTVSYGELALRADRLARRLAGLGVRKGSLVAVALPRSVELIVALLAVLKAGGAYCPLDPGHPPARLADVLADTGPVCVVTDSATRGVLPATAAPCLLVDRTDLPVDLPVEGTDDAPEALPLGAPDTSSPAYVIHTSGSTGRPKGVVVSHAAIDNRLRWMQDTFPLAPGDRVLQKTPSGFDVSVWEFFWALREGATLVLAEPDAHKDPLRIARLIREQAVHVCHFVPSMLQVFLAEPAAAGCTSLRDVFCSGEALARESARDFHRVLPGARLHNLYGPTEAAVDVTHHTCVPGAEGPVPLGRPVWNTRLYVLDAAGRPCPPGVAGELHLAGAQLAEGYLGRPELTAEVFTDDVLAPPGSPRTRTYRTGDRAAWTEDGEIHYLGRIDQQVKLRGQRLESGEVEARIAAMDGVDGVCVVVREDRPGDQRLVAYVTGDAAPGEAAVRAGLADVLPDWMVPTSVVRLQSLPLGPNGKLDRRALPAPAAADDPAGRAPRGPREEALTRLFAEALGRGRVGPDDSFFDLGGTSLLAARLAAAIRETFGEDVALGTLFRAPSPAALAARLGNGSGADTALDVLLPLRSEGDRPPLFVFHPAGGLSWCYSGLLAPLGPRQPVHGLQSRGLRDTSEPLAPSMEEMAADYAERIRTLAPNGPYRLLGWSVGGVVAHTVAVQLQQDGHEVDLLALMDAYPSDQWRELAGPTEAQALRAVLRMAGYESDGGEGELTKESVLAGLRREGSALAALPGEVLSAVVGVVAHNARLMRTHRHRVFDGDLLFFTAGAPRAESWLEPAAWKPYLSGVIDEHRLECLHPEMTRPPYLDAIADVLAGRLDALDANATRT